MSCALGPLVQRVSRRRSSGRHLCVARSTTASASCTTCELQFSLLARPGRTSHSLLTYIRASSSLTPLLSAPPLLFSLHEPNSVNLDQCALGFDSAVMLNVHTLRRRFPFSISCITHHAVRRYGQGLLYINTALFCNFLTTTLFVCYRFVQDSNLSMCVALNFNLNFSFSFSSYCHSY